MLNSSKVIIVGGGIIGAITAYFLGQHNLRAVIIERHSIASEASGAAAGELSPLSKVIDSGPMTDLSFYSLQLHRELVEPLMADTGIDYLFADTPMLRVAMTEIEEAELLSQFHAIKKCPHDMHVSWLDGNTLRQMSSWLSPNVRAGLFSEMDAQLETYRFTTAAAQAAEKHGAVVKTGTVVALRANGMRVTGVVLSNGELIEGDAVLLSMGPWTCFASKWIGREIPVEPLRGQIIKLKSPGPMPEYAISSGGCYVLPKTIGHILAGTTEEHAGFDRTVTAEGQSLIMNSVSLITPILSNAQVIQTSACLRPLSRDSLPILGQVPGWDNLYIATGHGRKGMLLSVATGKHMAQLIATGDAGYDISPFLLERFSV